MSGAIFIIDMTSAREEACRDALRAMVEVFEREALGPLDALVVLARISGCMQGLAVLGGQNPERLRDRFAALVVKERDDFISEQKRGAS